MKTKMKLRQCLRQFHHLPKINRIVLIATFLLVQMYRGILIWSLIWINRTSAINSDDLRIHWSIQESLFLVLLVTQLAVFACLMKYNYYRLGGDIEKGRVKFGMEDARLNETVLLWTRWVYFSAAIIVAFGCTFGDWYLSTWIALSLSILLFPCLFQAISRITFRIWPAVILAFAGAVLYLSVVGGRIGVLTTKLPVQLWKDSGGLMAAENIDRLPSTFKNSVILVALAPFFLFLARQIYDRYRKQTEDSEGKTTRRQLLTHWWFNPRIPMLDNSAIILLAGFAVVCVIAIGLHFPQVMEKTESNKTAESSAATESVNSSVTAPTVMQETTKGAEAETAETVAATNISVDIRRNEEEGYRITGNIKTGDSGSDDSPLPFFEYVAFLGTALSFIGSVTLFEIRDNTIIQSEYNYILYLSLQLHNSEQVKRNGTFFRRILGHLTRGLYGSIRAEKADRKQLDYCQVLANLFIHFSALDSENNEYHKTRRVMREIGKSKQLSNVSKSVLLSRMLSAFELALAAEDEAKPRKANQSKEKKEEAAQKVQMAELVFSASIQELLQANARCPATTDNNLLGYACLPITAIYSAQKMLYRVIEKVEMNIRLINLRIPIEDFTNIIQHDVLFEISRWQNKSNCIFQWMCDPGRCRFCRKKTRVSTGMISNSAQQGLRLMFLLYPVFAIVSILKRWPNLLPSMEKEAEIKHNEDTLRKLRLPVEYAIIPTGASGDAENGDRTADAPETRKELSIILPVNARLERQAEDTNANASDEAVGEALATSILNGFYYEYSIKPVAGLNAVKRGEGKQICDLGDCLKWYIEGKDNRTKALLSKCMNKSDIMGVWTSLIGDPELAEMKEYEKIIEKTQYYQYYAAIICKVLKYKTDGDGAIDPYHLII